MCTGLPVKCPLLTSDFKSNLDFLATTSKKYSNTKFNKQISPLKTDMFQADGQTVKTTLTVAFRKLANAPRKGYCLQSQHMRDATKR